MHKITLTPQHFEKPPLQRSRIHRYGFKPECAKCGAPLKSGTVAYRTKSKLLCETCGANAEID